MSRLTRYHQESLLTDEGGYYEPNASNYYDIAIKLGQIEDILEEYGIDSIEELELIMQENQKYKHLKYELGCPLDIFVNIMLGKITEIVVNYSDAAGYNSLYEEFTLANVSGIIESCYNNCLCIETNLCEVPIKDYKVNWFLKGDLSE